MADVTQAEKKVKSESREQFAPLSKRNLAREGLKPENPLDIPEKRRPSRVREARR